MYITKHALTATLTFWSLSVVSFLRKQKLPNFGHVYTTSGYNKVYKSDHMQLPSFSVLHRACIGRERGVVTLAASCGKRVYISVWRVSLCISVCLSRLVVLTLMRPWRRAHVYIFKPTQPRPAPTTRPAFRFAA